MALSLSTQATTPSATRPTSGSVSHQRESPNSAFFWCTLLGTLPLCCCGMWELEILSCEYNESNFVEILFEFLMILHPLLVALEISLFLATIQILSLWWFAPMSPAPSTPHRASNPIEAKSPRTAPSPLEVSIGEFSTNAYWGRTSWMMRAISRHIPLRFPSIPAPFPAELMSWHGKPPDTTSTIPLHGFPSKVCTSSQIGKGGRSPSFCLAHNTLAGYCSHSTAQTVRHPRSFPPSIPPPAPANKANSFIVPPLNMFNYVVLKLFMWIGVNTYQLCILLCHNKHVKTQQE